MQRKYDMPPGSNIPSSLETMVLCEEHMVPAAFIPFRDGEGERYLMSFLVRDVNALEDKQTKADILNILLTGEEEVPGMLAVRLTRIAHELFARANGREDDADHEG